MSKSTFRGQDMTYSTPKVGDILRDCSDGHFIEVLEILVPWTPDGPTWITTFMAVKIANKHGVAYQKKQEPFKSDNSSYRVMFDNDVPYNVDLYEKALKKAQNDLNAYVAFTTKHKDQWKPFNMNEV